MSKSSDTTTDTVGVGKKARNVLNTEDIRIFVQSIANEIFGVAPSGRRAELRAWFTGAAAKWLIREGEAWEVERLPDDAQPWALKALAEHQPLWKVSLDKRLRTRLHHLADWSLYAAPRQINKVSFEDALDKMVSWMLTIAPEDRDDYASAEVGTTRIMEVAKHAGLPAGCHWVSLNDASALEREGILMKHCVRSYADKVGDGSAQVYSLRDGDDLSLATLELSPHRSPQQLLDMWPCSAVARRERQRELDAGYRVLAFIQLRGRLNQDVSSAVIDAFLQLQSHLRSRGYVIWRGEEFDNCRLTGIVKDRGILEPVASFPAGAFIESMAWDGASDAVIPEGLRFATLEIYNARDTSRWPASLDARRIRLHKEIHYLDARSWQVEEVVLDSDLLVPSCADGELFLGRLEKLIFDEKSVFTGAPERWEGAKRDAFIAPGKYLSRLCAQARKVFLPWFRADRIELRDTEHLYAPGVDADDLRVSTARNARYLNLDFASLKNLAILGSAARSGHFSACSIQVGCNRSEHEGFRGLSGHAPSPADDRSTSLELAIALEELDLQRSGQPGEWISRLTEAQPDKTRLLGDWSFIRRLADFADRSSVRQVSFSPLGKRKPLPAVFKEGSDTLRNLASLSEIMAADPASDGRKAESIRAARTASTKEATSDWSPDEKAGFSIWASAGNWQPVFNPGNDPDAPVSRNLPQGGDRADGNALERAFARIDARRSEEARRVWVDKRPPRGLPGNYAILQAFHDVGWLCAVLLWADNEAPLERLLPKTAPSLESMRTLPAEIQDALILRFGAVGHGALPAGCTKHPEDTGHLFPARGTSFAPPPQGVRDAWKRLGVHLDEIETREIRDWAEDCARRALS
ncbi:hypothetical protein [Azotobacter vinelandii]